jgi:hypothetical protein
MVLPTRKRHSSTLPPTYHAQGQPRLDVCELPGPHRRAQSAELIIGPPRRLSSPELDAHASSQLACMSSSRSDHVEREFGQNSDDNTISSVAKVGENAHSIAMPVLRAYGAGGARR